MRKHVDSAFSEFDTVPQQSTRKPVQEEAGSFWDDNAGEADEWEEQNSNTTATPKKKEGIDQFLDDIGSMLNIHISNSVHEGVKSILERIEWYLEGANTVRNLGTSLWSGFASLINEEYALNLHFTIDGKTYIAKEWMNKWTYL